MKSYSRFSKWEIKVQSNSCVVYFDFFTSRCSVGVLENQVNCALLVNEVKRWFWFVYFFVYTDTEIESKATTATTTTTERKIHFMCIVDGRLKIIPKIFMSGKYCLGLLLKFLVDFEHQISLHIQHWLWLRAEPIKNFCVHMCVLVFMSTGFYRFLSKPQAFLH